MSALSGLLESRRITTAQTEQIPRAETISLREKHLGKSCKLFFRADPLKIVRAKGLTEDKQMQHFIMECQLITFRSIHVQ